MTSGQKYRGALQIYQFDRESYDLSFIPLPDGGLFSRSRTCHGKEELFELLSTMGLDRQDIEWTLESLGEDCEAYIPYVVLSAEEVSKDWGHERSLGWVSMKEVRKEVTLQDLIQRATSGQKLDSRSFFRPSLVYQVLRDPFWVWCNYHAPQSEAVEETTRYEELQQQRGIEYEQTWVQTRYPEAVKIEPDFGFEALKNTLQAMLRGYPAIYQPHLWDLGRETYGKADLLVRDTTSGSDLGPYRYRLVEIKRSKSLQDYQIIQVAAYNRMLGCIQGTTPDELFVALQETVEKVSYAASENELDEVLAKWKALRDGQLTPEPGRPPDVTGSPWRVYGNKVVEANKDLVLLAGIGSREREKLRGAGIHRVDQIWNHRLEEISEVLGSHYGSTAYFVAQAYKGGQPIPKPKCPLVIPRAKRHLYFDFETSDDVHPTQPPHVYLIGCWDAERSRYVHFLARGAEDEGKIFKRFIEYIGDVANTKLYHWTGFEIGEIHKVIQRWPVMEDPLLRLTSSCVDLKEMVKSAVYLPVPTFSLKCVAPALGFRWRQEGFGAFESMVCYWEYLDGADESTIARSILYNEDDCRAMWHVDRELTKRFV